MEINRNNFEIVMIDYLDGKLTPVEVAELMLFLEQHPDLKTEADGLGLVSLEEKAFVFEDKHTLHRSRLPALPADQVELLIDHLEGNLSTEAENDFALLLKHQPALQQELAHFKKTILVPDAALIYPYKKELKKNVAAIRPLYYYISAAAAAILILFFMLRPASQLPDEMQTMANVSRKNTLVSPRVQPSELAMQEKKVITPELIRKVSVVAVNRSTPFPVSNSVHHRTSRTADVLLSLQPKVSQVNFSWQPVELAATKLIPFSPSTVQKIDVHPAASEEFLSLTDLATEKLIAYESALVEEKNKPTAVARRLSSLDWIVIGAKWIGARNVKLKKQYDAEGNLEKTTLLAGNLELVRH